MTWTEVTRRLLGLLSLVVLCYGFIFQGSGIDVASTPAGEVQRTVTFYKDVFSSWTGLLEVVLFAVWFLLTIYHAGWLLVTGRPFRIVAAAAALVFIAFYSVMIRHEIGPYSIHFSGALVLWLISSSIFWLLYIQIADILLPVRVCKTNAPGLDRALQESL